ncbi:MAG: ribosome small subunit-dependent GTPase A [Lachnospiraceae bacterium]|jgi:ribosome biogenesis GTPase
MTGKIVKGISGFYYVYAAESGIYECRARGLFRKDKIKPLVGDNVEITVTDEDKKTGNVEAILPRNNELRRPACSNVDLALIIFSCDKPSPNLVVLDKMLIMMELNEVPQVLCFNKKDLVSEARIGELREVYSGLGCPVLFTDMINGDGTEELEQILRGKTTVVTGPSGVGKSSFTNTVVAGPPGVENTSFTNSFRADRIMEVGSISEKLGRGKNTTRHTELLPLKFGGYIMDTPGFTSLDAAEVKSENLKYFYPEFEKFNNRCRFNGCLHANEPGCAVKASVEDGNINRIRYENYLFIYNELTESEKRRY